MTRKPSTPCFYTISDVADILNVHPRTIVRHIDCGDLKAHKFGDSVRISDDDFQTYMALNRRG
jgi:excisionase family DNA binding protein